MMEQTKAPEDGSQKEISLQAEQTFAAVAKAGGKPVEEDEKKAKKQNDYKNAKESTIDESTSLLKKTTSKKKTENDHVYDDSQKVDDITEIPNQPISLKVFSLFSILSIIASLLMAASQILSLFLLKGTFLQHLLRIYMTIFCLLFIAAEFDIKWILRYASPMKSWMYRGFLYSFIGAIGTQMAISALAEEMTTKMPTLTTQTLSLLFDFAGYPMFGVGIVYMVMGLLCMKSYSEKLRSRYNNQVQKVMEERS